MTSARPLPLAAASVRLRGKPGRPRTRPPAAPKVELTTAAAVGALAPRLLDLEAAARYLGVSPWTIRDLIDRRTLPRVRVRLPGGRELKRVLIDVRDLDRLIDQAKDG